VNWADLFVYHQDSGVLTWKRSRPGRGCIAGRIAGTAAHHGYRAVMVDGKKHYIHRIVWEINNGTIPTGLCIDHIDGDCSNNRIENLRIATLSENQRNSRLPKNNKTGVHGVWLRRHGYVAHIGNKHLGSFDNFFDACCARKSAERHRGYHENHGRKSA
jgi:hypothetical protein